MTQSANKLLAEYRQVLAETHIENLIDLYAVRQVRTETAMSIAYLNGSKRINPEKWSPEHGEYLATLFEINAEASATLNEVPASASTKRN